LLQEVATRILDVEIIISPPYHQDRCRPISLFLPT
jgi:hypothetical protein